MFSDDQYETFWYDLKLPDLVEENDSSKDKISELYNVNQITKDGWKLISIIPFSIKKNNKEIQIHRLYFQSKNVKLKWSTFACFYIQCR